MSSAADRDTSRDDATIRSSRGVAVVAVATTIVIAAGAFVLSFAALTDLAAKAGQPPKLAWLWPVIVDGTILQATVAVVAQARRPATAGARRFFWTVLAAAALVSIAGNALHAAVSTTRVLATAVAALVATIAPISLLAATHGLALLMAPSRDTTRDDATPAATAAAADRDTSDTQAPDATPHLLFQANEGDHQPTATAAPDSDQPAASAAPAADHDTATPTETPATSTGERDDLIRELAAEGLSLRAIARELETLVGIKVHPSTVGRVIERGTTSDEPTPQPASVSHPSFRLIAGGTTNPTNSESEPS